MDQIKIIGGTKLQGQVRVGGAKNSALKLMAASLLTEEKLVLSNMPHLVDITTMATLLARMGVELSMEGASADLRGHAGRVLSLCARDLHSTQAPYDLVRQMRASILVLGPLLARFGKARVSLPGGCAIGTRPVDLHLNALKKMGATIDLVDGYIEASAPGLQGADIEFPFVSVGATENAMMAATLAKGETILKNAACEPEISDLGECLQKMGAKIEGLGTSTIRIQGVDRLQGADHHIVTDRIVAGSFAVAAAITNGELELLGAQTKHLSAFVDAMRLAGIEMQDTETGILVKRINGELRATDIDTAPYPGFPTDLQAQFMTLMCVANGASTITETIFENRFMHVAELKRMGANIEVTGNKAVVTGVKKLKGAPVMATDLRASVSLVLAGLVAQGETLVNRVYHLDRGYERLEDRLAACGAHIERLHNRHQKDSAA